MTHTRIIRSSLALACLLSLLALPATSAEPDWPSWRGPDGSGIAAGAKWNPKSLATPKILWQTNVGKGWSSLVVKGDRVFTMGNKGDQDIVYCLNVNDGKEVWKESYPCKAADYPGPRSTPTVDGTVLYTVSRDGQVFCWDAAKGTKKWAKNISRDFKGEPPQWGHAACIRVDGEMLILNAGPAGLALNKKTGAEIWSSGPGKGGYAFPVVCKSGTKKCAAIFSAKAILGVDLANGNKLWSHTWETSYDVNAADPIVVDDTIFITSGYNKGCALLKLGGDAPRVIWQNKTIASHFSSCVLIDGNLYGISGNAGGGSLKCVEFQTGNEKWAKPLGFGGLMAADKKLIVINEKGKMFIAEASPSGYREIASAEILPKPKFWTAPVFCRGLVFCRNEHGDLLCVDLTK